MKYLKTIPFIPTVSTSRRDKKTPRQQENGRPRQGNSYISLPHQLLVAVAVDGPPTFFLNLFLSLFRFCSHIASSSLYLTDILLKHRFIYTISLYLSSIPLPFLNPHLF
jgi:hypothetical protein